MTQHENNINHGKIIRYSSKYRKRYDSANRNAFAKSISSGVIPLSGYSEKKTRFEINGLEKEKDRIDKILSCISRYDYGSLESKIPLAVHKMAEMIAFYGYCLYEIVLQPDGHINLYNFRVDHGYRLPWHFLHFIPISHWENDTPKFVLLENKKIWCVKIPKTLGGERKHKKILNRLSASELSFIDPNSYVTFHKIKEIYCRKVTNSWGWSFDTYPQDSTHFFNAYNHTTLCWARAVFREHIIQEMNSLFKRLEIDCSLQIHGLLKPSEIIDIKEMLIDGKIDFKTVYDKTSIY